MLSNFSQQFLLLVEYAQTDSRWTPEDFAPSLDSNLFRVQECHNYSRNNHVMGQTYELTLFFHWWFCLPTLSTTNASNCWAHLEETALSGNLLRFEVPSHVYSPERCCAGQIAGGPLDQQKVLSYILSKTTVLNCPRQQSSIKSPSNLSHNTNTFPGLDSVLVLPHPNKSIQGFSKRDTDALAHSLHLPNYSLDLISLASRHSTCKIIAWLKLKAAQACSLIKRQLVLLRMRNKDRRAKATTEPCTNFRQPRKHHKIMCMLYSSS